VIGSAPVAGQDARTQHRTRAVVATLCVVAALSIGLAGWGILVGRMRAGGATALVAGVSLVVAGVLASRSNDVRSRLVVSFGDRLFDGGVLAAVAWASRTDEPAASLGALLALAAGFIAAYVRARGSALGYLIEESAATRAVRVGVISAALLAGWTEWALFAVAAWMLLVTLVRTSQVAKEERV
jgi:hypothetical protein